LEIIQNSTYDFVSSPIYMVSPSSPIHDEWILVLIRMKKF
jgi:hypothetical protein